MSKKSAAAKDETGDKERKNESKSPLDKPSITFGYEYFTDDKLAELGFGARNGIYQALRDDVIHLLSTKRSTDKKLVIFPKAEDMDTIDAKKLNAIATHLRQNFNKTGIKYNVSVSVRHKSLAFIPKKDEKAEATND